MNRQDPDFPPSTSGLPTWTRFVLAIVGMALLALGVYSVFITEGGVASASLIVVGALLGYLALANQRILRISTSGAEFEEVSSALTRTVAAVEASGGEGLKEQVATQIEPVIRLLRTDVQEQVRQANESRAATKKELLTELCELVEIPPLPLGVGSSIPAEALRQAARKVNVSADGPMPIVASRIVEKGGLKWEDSDFSTGSTVTASGLRKVVEATRRLLK